MKKQHISNQKGEVAFRKKLYLQQVENMTVYDNEFDATGIKSILKARMNKTLTQMTQFLKHNIALSPYIEIGAERCQRSLIMENDLGLNGAAVDISFDMLKSCDHFRDVFKKTNSPLRICCDANNLPFKSSSIPFIFCYETLHHFPEPTPITNEIYRLLSPGGSFFFDEEPYKQVLHFNLYKGRKIYSKESLDRSKVRKLIDYFFCERSCNEVEHGIIENDNLSLQLWKQALEIFDVKEVKLTSLGVLKSNLFSPKSYLKYFLAYLFGGNISGNLMKNGIGESQNKSIYNTLICPSCLEINREATLDQMGLSYICTDCSKIYPTIDQVLFLFSYDKFSELYPDIFNSFQKNSSL